MIVKRITPRWAPACLCALAVSACVEPPPASSTSPAQDDGAQEPELEMGVPDEMGDPPDMKEPTEDMQEPPPEEMDMGSDMPPDMKEPTEEDMKPPAELVLAQVDENGETILEFGETGWRNEQTPLELELGQSAPFTLESCRGQECRACERVNVESELDHPLYTTDPRFDIEPRPGAGVFGLSFWSPQASALELSVSCEDVDAPALRVPFTTSSLELGGQAPALWFDASAPSTVSDEITEAALTSGEVSVWEPVSREESFLYEGGSDPDLLQPEQRFGLRAAYDRALGASDDREIHGAELVEPTSLGGRSALQFPANERAAYLLSHYDEGESRWRNNARYESDQGTTVFLVARPAGWGGAEQVVLGCEDARVSCNTQFVLTGDRSMRVDQNPGGRTWSYEVPGGDDDLDLTGPQLFTFVLDGSAPPRLSAGETSLQTDDVILPESSWYLSCLGGMPYMFDPGLKTFRGDIAEVLIFPTASDQGASAIEDYLAQKYGLGISGTSTSTEEEQQGGL